MKILVSTEKRTLEHDLNGLELFTLYTVITGTVLTKEYVRVGFRQSLPTFLAQKHISVLLCFRIGKTAHKELDKMDVEVVEGVNSDSDRAVSAYLASELDRVQTQESVAGECLGQCDCCVHPCH